MSLVGIAFDSKCNFAPSYHLAGASLLPLDMGCSFFFFGGIQHSPVNGCSSTILYMLFTDNRVYVDNIYGKSLLVQWLGVYASTAGDLGFDPWSEN